MEAIKLTSSLSNWSWGKEATWTMNVPAGADGMVRITFNEPGGLPDVPFSVPELDDLGNRAGVFKDVSKIASVNLTGAGHFEKVC
jgi:hypothetical protein